MKNKKIKYIGYFDFQDSKIERNYVTSAANKMESICISLNSAAYQVEIVSMSPVTENKFKLYKGRKEQRHDGLTLKLFTSWGGNNKFFRITKMFWHLIAMFCYLVSHTKKNEPILVYHSQGYYNTILWAKKIRKFKLILEVEEIYQDVGKPKFSKMAKWENNMFEAADAYIFPTELLNKKLNTENKPYTIIYGTYKVEPQVVDKFDDGKIHVVYAGTFDPRKGGAEAAVATAAYLPENYHLHICGFGNENDINKIKETISYTQKKSKATITFDGLKKDREYIKFIQQCHIGLSTQNPTAVFNATSFPSKILSYMANGLSVVSNDIPAVTTSKINDFLIYYHKQIPRDIAQAIMQSDLKNNNRAIIINLVKQFNREISYILS